MFCGDHLLAAKLRRSSSDASAGAVEEVERIVTQIRGRWPQVRIVLRADSGFAREALMSPPIVMRSAPSETEPQSGWCEANAIDYVLGLARNPRLVGEIAAELAWAAAEAEQTRKPARRFKDFRYRTLDSWSCARRVVGKAEQLIDGSGEVSANPHFVVTSLKPEACSAQPLYERLYCARGGMENRIKECQLDLFADRTSTRAMRANQLRLVDPLRGSTASMAYVLLDALRRIALPATRLAQATAGTIRLKLLKIGALVRLSVRRVTIKMASGHPWQCDWAIAHRALMAAVG